MPKGQPALFCQMWLGKVPQVASLYYLLLQVSKVSLFFPAYVQVMAKKNIIER